MKINGKMFINFLSFVAIILVGLALILKNTSFGDKLADIASIIAYAMLGIFSFFYARSKRNLIFIILWIAAVVLIVVSYII